MFSNLPRMMHGGLSSISTRFPNSATAAAATQQLLMTLSPYVSPNIITVHTRSYRGDSGDMKYRRQISPNPTQDQIIQREEALLKVAAPKYEMIQERHVRMPKLEEIPQASLPLEFREGNYSKEELEVEVRKKRLVYRSKQRGW
jgi:hypothetical protein